MGQLTVGESRRRAADREVAGAHRGAVEPATGIAGRPSLWWSQGAHPVRDDPHRHPLVHHHVDRGLEIVGVGTVVALPHADAHREDGVGIIVDLRDAFEGHPISES